jgi:hypothetical protein
MECLEYVIENDTKSHLYYKNFTLAKTKDDNIPVGTISCYSFPDFTLDVCILQYYFNNNNNILILLIIIIVIILFIGNI